MNIPNTITLIRVILIPFFVDLMIYEYYKPALFVFVVACLTDALDGMVARLTNTKTELGAFLDPVADKLLIVSSFITLAIMDRIPIWLVIIVVSRDIILGLGSLVISLTGHTLMVKPSLAGKATTVLQFAVVSVTLIFIAYNITHGSLDILYWSTAVTTIVSGVQYVMQGMKIMG